MGAFLTVVAKITAVPVVAQLLQRLTGKLLGNRGVEAKVSAAVAPAAIIAFIIMVLQAVNPELGEVAKGQEANLLGAVVAVGAFLAYFTKNVEA